MKFGVHRAHNAMPSAAPSRRRRESPAESPDRLTTRVVAVCDAVGDFIESWGFRSIHGRVWTLLALSSRPLAQAEIAERLGVSRSLVSMAMTELDGFGLVRSVGPERQAPWEANLDVWPIITDVLRSREWMLMERARLALEAASNEAEYRQRVGEPPIYDARRIRWLLLMTEFAQTTLRTIMNLRMPRSVDALSSWLQRAGRAVERLQVRLPRAPE
jgi:DNA-binding transcriptional regulator GbsR (MarR family)